jgi:hypothetical protein
VNTRVVSLLILSALLALPASGRAENSGQVKDFQDQELPAEAPGEKTSATEENEPGVDRCNQQPTDQTMIEGVQSGTYEYSCRLVRWFDGLFGQSRDFAEEDLYGRLSLGMAWNEYEGFDPSLRFRLRTDLPNLSSRWNAFLGRVDDEDFIRGTETQQDSAFRRGINDSEQPEWLFGLGYKGHKRGTNGWDFSVGVRLRLPPQPYARAMYEKTWRFTNHHDLRYRQTFFARYDKGYGTTTNLDSVRELSEDNVLRVELIGTLADYTEGVDWWAAQTWYHRLAPQRGISLRTFARGRTQGEVGLTEYGFELSFRRQLHHDWLFINVGPTLTWPRYFEDERRQASWGVAALLEMDFGYYVD